MKNLLVALMMVTLLTSCQSNIELADKSFLENGQHNNNNQTKVLTVGTFHFDFPNLDVSKIEETNQIDVLDTKHQKEIETIINKLVKFKPSKIIIERPPEMQNVYDSLYNSYLIGKHELNRSEEQQIGFRLAKRLKLEKLYCVDAWGNDYESVQDVIDGNDTQAKEAFFEFFYKNPDSILMSFREDKRLFKTQGIMAELKRINSEEFIERSLGDYLVGIFKYESKDYKQLGPDYVTSWWFNRNLRIFRNIQRVNTSPDDRIIVLYGAGHMNLLNIFFDSSPEYELMKTNDYLE